MSITISEEILRAAQLTESEFRQEIALHMFTQGRLTLGYVSKLADMPLRDFRKLLRQRNIPLYSYEIKDFELDLKNLRSLGRL